MVLPNREHAYIPESKLVHYLLSLSHPVGKSKARFFIAHGFDMERAKELEDELLQIAHQREVGEMEKTVHGTKYAVEGSINTPRGTTVKVRTIWILDSNGHPRLVTAYPAGRSE